MPRAKVKRWEVGVGEEANKLRKNQMTEALQNGWPEPNVEAGVGMYVQGKSDI